MAKIELKSAALYGESMFLALEPSRFVGQPLITKATAKKDFTAMCDGLRAGRIMFREVAKGRSL